MSTNKNYVYFEYPNWFDGNEDKIEHETQFDRIENFIKKSEGSLTEDELVTYINTITNLQNEIKTQSKVEIEKTLRVIFNRLPENSEIKTILENNANTNQNIEDRLNFLLKSFFACDYDSEIRQSLICFRKSLLSIFELYIDKFEVEQMLSIKSIKINETKIEKIIKLSQKDPHLTYAQIAKRLDTTEDYVKKVMYKNGKNQKKLPKK